MSAARRPVPLDPEVLRVQVAANKLVRVAITPSAQFPEGTVGRVRRVGDPAVDGDEFVFVEVSVDGTKDVLPFALSDLGPAGARGKTPAGPKAPKPTPEPTGPLSRPLPTPTVTPLRPVASAPKAPAAPPASAAPVASTAPIATQARANSGTGKSAARGPKKPSPPVCVTLSSTDEPGQWRVDAKVGAKAVVKGVAVSAARLWDMVQLLDSPPLAEAVRTHLEEQRRVAAERAQRLRAELAAVQAELAALPGAD